MKWLEDELELNALHNPDSRRGSGNEKVATTQRAALSMALAGRVEVTTMNTISGSASLPIVCLSRIEFMIATFSSFFQGLFRVSYSYTCRTLLIVSDKLLLTSPMPYVENYFLPSVKKNAVLSLKI